MISKKIFKGIFNSSFMRNLVWGDQRFLNFFKGAFEKIFENLSWRKLKTI